MSLPGGERGAVLKTRPKNRRHSFSTCVCFAVAVLLLACSCSVALSLVAPERASATTNNPLTIDGNPLRIKVYDDSTFEVWRKQGANYVHQYYGNSSRGAAIFLNGGNQSFHYGGGSGTFPASDHGTRWTAESHTQPNPWTIVTVLKCGATGVKITETVSYNNGDNYYRMVYGVSNGGASTFNDLRFMCGCDAYFGGDDGSWGYWNDTQKMVYMKNPNLLPGIMALYSDTSQSPPSHYMEGDYADVYSACVSGNHLPDTVVSSSKHDSGYCLEWDRATLAPGQTWRVYAFEKWTADANVQVLAPAERTVTPGQTITLPFVVTNFETGADTFNLTVTSTRGWSVSAQPQIALAAGVSGTVNVQHVVPPGTQGQGDTVTLRATSATNTTITNSDSCRVNGGYNQPEAITPDSYLCEGSTAWGFDCYITVMNPNNKTIHVNMIYNTDRGAIPGQSGSMAPLSTAWVNPRDVIGDADFSAEIHCAERLPITADRTMMWGTPGVNREAHCSVGVGRASKVWYLAEGSSEWGFECWLALQNPNDTKANVRVTYMIENEGPRSMDVKVPAKSRRTYGMANTIGAKDASIKVESDIPVTAERAMYRNNRREGHASIGTTAPAQDYYLAEGTTAWGFTTYVLVQNPQSSPNRVDVTYMTPQGPKQQPTFTMPANSRTTIRVNDVPGVSNTDLSTKVHGSKPLVAERAMYWRANGQEVCHDSIGMAAPHSNFYLADGWTNNGGETWTLVQNPNNKDVKVRISYLKLNGEGNVVKNEVIPANSRRTFDMRIHSGIDGIAGIMVESLTSGKKIMCERSMYWDNRGVGTDTIGGASD